MKARIAPAAGRGRVKREIAGFSADGGSAGGLAAASCIPQNVEAGNDWRHQAPGSVLKELRPAFARRACVSRIYCPNGPAGLDLDETGANWLQSGDRFDRFPNHWTSLGKVTRV